MAREKSHVEQITDPCHAYNVRVGGTLDEFNTFQYGKQITSKFQPNTSLTIENVGDGVVRNPRLVVNGRRDWFSIDRILEEIINPGMTDQEKTFAVWNFVRWNLQEGHSYNSIVWEEGGSVTRFLNAVGTGACGTFHGITPMLLAAAGVHAMCGYVSFGAHAAQKECWDGTDHYLDAMLSAGGRDQPRGHFPLRLDNLTVAGVEETIRDRYQIDRCGFGPQHFQNVSYFGRNCFFWRLDYRDPHAIEWNLRPGEKITFTWEDCRKTWASQPLEPRSGNGNGTVSYTPRAIPETGVAEMRCPYPIVGIEFEGEFGPSGGAEVRFNDGDWQQVWEGSGKAGTVLPDDRPEFHEPVYTDSFEMRFTDLTAPPRVTATFQTYLRSLPSLGVGENAVAYEDETDGEKRLRVTHTWRESSEADPPLPAPGPVAGDESTGVFRWKEPEDGPRPAAWEFFLSRREDLAWPHMACFHAVVRGEATYTVPHFGAFSRGKTYYWRVRPCGAEGVWGSWSETWRFTADVPSSPFGLRIEDDGGYRYFVRWDHTPAPGRSIRFEVYGDSEEGFTPRLESQTGLGGDKPDDQRFQLPANLLATVEETHYEITQAAPAFFRVVAVDEKGARSTPPCCVAAPHPKVLPLPLPPAHVGKEYRAHLPVRANAGKWIANLRPDLPKGTVRHGADELRFQMVHSPDWLSIDTETGEISGVPAGKDAGRQDFFVEVMEGNGRGHTTQLFITVEVD